MRKKQFRLKPAYAAVLLAFTAQVTTGTAHANPVGAAVANGQASFATKGKTLTVTNTPGTIINWQGFSIGANEITRFAQQSASSAVLNRVIANNPSNILGSLQSNGRVFLVNPSGIVFGAGSTVNVAGMVASTLNLSNSDFIAGRYNFTNTPGAHNISNAGSITAAQGNGQRGGQIYLIAPNVENTGIINAPNGEILLAAGHSVELVNSNDPNLRVNITAPAGNATNVGQLVASSGSLGLFGAVVRNSGTVSADSATLQGGKIVFKATQRVDAGGTISAQGVGGGSIAILADMQGGTVNVTGTLDASSIAPSLSALPPSPSASLHPLPLAGEGNLNLPSPVYGRGAGGEGVSATTNGGQIETSAAHVNIADTARVTTAAAACTEPCLSGLAGTWLIDPFDFTIAATGGNITGAALTANLGGGNISILSTNGTTGTLGDVNVNDVVTWSANKLTLNAQNNININANLNGSGTASLALEYGQQAVAAGNLSDYFVHAAVNLAAGNNFSTKLGSNGVVKNYTVITSLGAAGSTTATDLQGMNGGLAGNYALGSNIDATATSAWNAGAGFAPVGNLATQFAGTFDGLGHTVSNLTINRPTTNYVGLFGYMNTGSVIRNVGLIGGSVSGGYDVGGLVGFNLSGTINNSYAIGNVSGSGSYGYTGGLVGLNRGVISSSYATGNVSVSGSNYGGGLVGGNFTGGAISNSYATGNVSGSYGGGLVGDNFTGTISNSYAMGSVSGGVVAGGLVGHVSSGAVSNSYAMGSVSGSANIGGLVGLISSGTVTNSYWNITTSGQATSAGGTGLTTTQMQTAANFTGFTFTSTPGATGNNWVMVDANGTLNNAAAAAGATFPMLASEYSTTINNAHQLQLMEMAPAASYTLGGNIDASKTATSTDVWGSSGFVPIGNVTTNFTGTFDGLGHTINSLFINLPSLGVGLFGDTGTGSVIRNVGLVGGSVSGSSYVGGLVGRNRGTVSNSSATGGVVGTSSYVGGLVGGTRGAISNSNATGNVSGSSGVGGLVGNIAGYGSVSNSYATGNITSAGGGPQLRLGGLAGFASYGTTISNSYATGSVTGTNANGNMVGGLVGLNQSTVSNSYATGSVSGAGVYVGGLLGFNYGAVSNSYATGNASGYGKVGGLVGRNSGTITNGYSIGSVSGNGYVGGLVGYNASAVSNSYATGSVSGAAYAGGLVGWSFTGSTVSNSYARGNITGTAANCFAGGLVGYLQGAVSNSYASGNVTGVAIVGGLVGGITATGSVGNSYATGNVSGTVGNAGGLVGVNSATVSNSYATGNVSGAGNIGGLVGHNQAAINTSYSTGLVSGTTSVGGLVGLSAGGTVTSSYWNTTTSLQATSAGGTGLTTTQMQTAANFTGFVFTTTPGATGNNWVMVDANGTLNNAAGAAGATRPMLASEYSTTINNAHQLQLMEMALGASYTLGSNIAALSTGNSTDVWGSAGFVPVGNVTTNFTGTFDGLSHTISNLTINLPTTDNVGLFGYTGAGSVIKNVGMVGGSVTGSSSVGGLVGYNPGTVSNAYATGSVNASGAYGSAGGLVGQNVRSGSISNSYATGSVNASGACGNAGGLVGEEHGTGSIGNSYATGSVSGSNYVGGLVGSLFTGPSYVVMVSNSYATGSVSGSGTYGYHGGLVGASSRGIISNSYATGSVSGSGTDIVGGLVGGIWGSTITNSFWNTTTSLLAIGLGGAGAAQTGATGLTAADMMKLSSFSSWNTATPNTIANTGGSGATWRIYEGHTAPLLTSFLTGLTLSGAPDLAVTYTGAAQSGAAFTLITNVLGAAATGTNAGFYNGYYSAQQGYDLSGGNLTINKAALSVTANAAAKTYNGLAYTGGNGVTYTGLVNGEASTVLGGTLAYGGTAQGAINAGSYVITPGGLTSGNYTISYTDGALTVSKAALSVTANVAAKTYDGLAYTGGNGVAYTGLVNGEASTVLGGTLAYGGTSQGAVNAGSYLITPGGLTSGNYTLSYVDGALTVNAAALNAISMTGTRAYDGTANVNANIFTLSGLVGGQTLTLGGVGTVADKNVGVNKTVTLGSLALGDGTGLASNYTFTGGTQTATITAAAITLSTGNISKTYDGLLTAAGVAAVTGGTLFGGDSISGGTFAFTDKNAGSANKTVTASGITVNDGNGGGNYSVTYANNTTSTITAAALNVTANAAAKTYDGLAYSGGNGVAYTGLVNGEASTVLGGTLAYGGTAQGAINAGSYVVTPGGLTSGNYTISYTDGALAVNKAALSVAANAAAKTYDGLAYSGGNGVAYTGLVNGEASTVLGGTLAYGGTSQGATNAGSYLITPSGLTSGNYTLSYVDGALTVNKTALTAALIGTPVKVYDGGTAATLAASNYSLSGFVAGEGASVGQTAGTYNSKDVATATTINATLAANNFTGTGSTLLTNYFLPTTASGAGSITPAGLAVTANALSKTAGNADPLLTYMTAGLQAPDTATSTLSGALARLAGETAGVYAINQGTLVSLSTNYTMSYVPADFGIVAAPVVVPPVVVAPAPVVVAPPPVAVTPPPVVATLAPVMNTLVNSIIVLPPSVPFNPPTPPVIMQTPVAAPVVSLPIDAAGTVPIPPVNTAAAAGTPSDTPPADAQTVIVVNAAAPVVTPIAAAPLPVCK